MCDWAPTRDSWRSSRGVGNAVRFKPALFMRVRSERAQKAEITGTRRAESPRRSQCTTSQGARPEDARQIGLIRARSRSLMNSVGQSRHCGAEEIESPDGLIADERPY